MEGVLQLQRKENERKVQSAYQFVPAFGVRRMEIDLWHNILWSRYKGAAFSEFYQIAKSCGLQVNIFQIARTDSDQALLAPIDEAVHRYPYELVFDGNYSAVPKWRMVRELARRGLGSKADICLIAGYDRLEYMVQLVVAKAKRQKVGVFCDSTIYDRPQSLARRLVKNAFFSLCDGVFCYGERSEQFIESHGVPSEKIHIRVQSTLPLKEMSRAEILARRAAVRQAPPHFVYVGRLAAVKGLPWLIDSFSAFLSRSPGARLSMVGSGALKADLELQIATLGIQHAVSLLGSRSGGELADTMLDASALVLPSSSEPWGLVVNEAMALGLPVLVSQRCGCVPELVVDGLTGFAVRYGDSADFVDKMAKMEILLRDDHDLVGRCLDHISRFNPRASAIGILRGCEQITGASFLSACRPPAQPAELSAAVD